MLFRYRARNWPDSLSEEERTVWQQHRQQRLTSVEQNGILNLSDFFKTLEHCREESITEAQKTVLNELEAYGKEIEASLSTVD
jgi:exodeoxyribonuclease-1